MARHRAWALVGCVSLALGAWLAGAIAAFYVGFGGFRWGWAWSVLVFTALPTVFVTVLVRRAWRPITAGAVATVGIGLAILTVAITPLDEKRLLHAIEDAEVPATWRQVSEETSGHHWCFDYCPSAFATHVAPGPAEDVRVRLEAAFTDAGFQVVERYTHPGGEVETYRRGSITVRCHVTPLPDASVEVYLSAAEQ
jgi:hypothetical protein